MKYLSIVAVIIVLLTCSCAQVEKQDPIETTQPAEIPESEMSTTTNIDSTLTNPTENDLPENNPQINPVKVDVEPITDFIGKKKSEK